ncbi:S8 family serine peptidase [Chromatiaceae bacterium AAb-1]|nr:S8 family serine peptidase [Chromatiaceae bacterium AAb-1]
MGNKLLKLSPLALALLSVPLVQAVQFSAGENYQQLDVISISHGDKGSKKDSYQRLLQVAEPKRYILELEGEAAAVSNKLATARTAGKFNLSSAQVSQYQQQLDAQQQHVMQAVKKHFPDVIASRQFKVLFNGIAVQGNELNAEQLRQLPGVKRVYEDRLVHVQMDTSLPLINVPAVWQASGGQDTAGKGIRIAVIDSGIRPENPMFYDHGIEAPASLPGNDYCRTTEPTFCNNKLIVARYYEAPAATIDDEYDNSPLGYNSHGTHVAGTAAGRNILIGYGGKTADISGVAPGAWLMVYKALYFNGSTASGLTSSLMTAMEDAVLDGADVINNSWGGGAGGSPEDSPYQRLYEAAEAAGVIVVTAAGNDGNGASTIGCPGCVESGITVANTQTGKESAQLMTIPGMEPVFMVEGDSSVELIDLSPTALAAPVISALLTEPVNYEGCSAFAPNTFADSYALISRGTCTFEQKAINAAAAGARAVIIQNNVDEPSSVMIMGSATIPGVMISKADGEAILAKLAAGSLQVSLSPVATIYTNSLAVNVLNSSSSRGPNGDNRFIKPDLAAPGTNILSAASPDSNGEFTLMTGTSMASPHIAGAAALIKAQRPGWTPAQVKAALTTTSNPDVKDDDTVTLANAFAKGAGLVNVQAALQAGLAVAPVSVAGPDCFERCSFTVKATNLLNKAVSWTGSISFEDSQISGRLAVGSTGGAVLRLTAGSSTETSFLVTVETDAAERDKWYFGEIVWKPSDTSVPDARMPVAVFAGNSSEHSLLKSTSATAAPGEVVKLQTVLTNNSGLAKTRLTVALAAATELAGSPVVTGPGIQDSLVFNEDTKVISWTGTVEPAKVALLSDSTFSLPSLTDIGGFETFPCGSSCDDAEIRIDVTGLGMMFLRRTVSSITLGTNGYILFNNATLSNTHLNSQFPTGRVSGAMLAPFWADLDLTETGGWIYTLFSDYLVIEWKDAKLFEDSSNRYTFQVILGLDGTDEVYVNYVSLGALPDALTVGLQDLSGQIGSALYFNSEGEAPATGAYASKYTSGDSVTLEYPVTVPALETTGASWSVVQGESVTRQLLQNAEIKTSRQIIRSDLSFGEKAAAAALSLLVVEPEGAVAAARITTQPQRGTVTLDAVGNATYTPAAGFSGTDSFGFVLVDEGGNQTKEATVQLTVTAVSTTTEQKKSGGTFPVMLILLVLPFVLLRHQKQ